MNPYKPFVTKFLFKTLLSHHKTRCYIRFTLSVRDLEAVRALLFMSTSPHPLPIAVRQIKWVCKGSYCLW